MKASDVHRDAFVENLGTDWVIVDANGRVVGRTADEASARATNFDSAPYFYFTGKDFEEAKASAETKGGGTFDHDGDGKVGGSKPKPKTEEPPADLKKDEQKQPVKAESQQASEPKPAAKKSAPKAEEPKKTAPKKK